MGSSSTASAPDQSGARLPRKKLTWLVIAALVIGILGWFGPPLYLQFMKLIPEGVTITYSGAPSQARVVDYQALTQNEPIHDAAHCQSETPTLDCFVSTGEVEIDHVITTSEGNKFFELNQDAHSTGTLDGNQFFERSDHSVISRDSGFPAPDTQAFSTTVLKDTNLVFESVPRQRDGLHFFFPFSTEKRSYPGFVQGLGVARPIDFVDEGTLHGHDIYHFHQQVDATVIMDSNLKINGDEQWNLPPFPAAALYTEQELDQRGLSPEEQVNVDMYLAGAHSFYVEPRTGLILDYERTTYVFAAPDEQEAQQMSEDFHETGNPHQIRTLYHHTNTFDESSQQAALDRATPQVNWLHAMQIFAWVAKAITTVLVIWIVVIVLRYRFRTASQ